MLTEARPSIFRRGTTAIGLVVAVTSRRAHDEVRFSTSETLVALIFLSPVVLAAIAFSELPPFAAFSSVGLSAVFATAAVARILSVLSHWIPPSSTEHREKIPQRFESQAMFRFPPVEDGRGWIIVTLIDSI
jgi:hypothetical protein